MASERVRINEVKTLSDDWYVLKKTTFDFLRRDGTWQEQRRETYDRGNGAAVLLYNREKKTVVLIRQFRFPAYVNGLEDGMLIEVCAGLLDKADPEACIRKEAEEEAGFVVHNPRKVFESLYEPGIGDGENCSFLWRNMSRIIASRRAEAMKPRARTSK